VSYKPQEILEVAGFAAEVMMKNGGETYRVEEMIAYLCAGAGMDKISSFVIPTGIVISVSHRGGAPETIVVRLRERGINLEKVSLVNDFSRNMATKKWHYGEAMERLRQIDSASNSYNKYLVILTAAMASGLFTLFLGGTGMDAGASFMTSLVIQSLIFFSLVREINFFSEFLGGFLAVLLGISFVKAGLGQSLDSIVIGAIIPLVPGVAVTNAVRDVVKGELLSGVVRTFEAFWISVAIAAGVAASFYLFG
jgi:uncharacterized membrane protein YjjP (DUF1212 family)